MNNEDTQILTQTYAFGSEQCDNTSNNIPIVIGGLYDISCNFEPEVKMGYLQQFRWRRLFPKYNYKGKKVFKKRKLYKR